MDQIIVLPIINATYVYLLLYGSGRFHSYSLSLSPPSEFDESKRKPGESSGWSVLSVKNSSELAREKHETKCEHLHMVKLVCPNNKLQLRLVWGTS